MMSKKIIILGIILVFIFVGFIGVIFFTGGDLVYIEDKNGANDYTTGSILDFTSTSSECVDRFYRDIYTSLNSTSKFTVIDISQNMALTDSNYILSSPKLERTGSQNYTVFINSIEKKNKPTKNCTAKTRYNLSVKLPYSEDQRFTLNIKHNGKNVGTINNGEGWSSGSAISSGSNQPQ